MTPEKISHGLHRANSSAAREDNSPSSSNAAGLVRRNTTAGLVRRATKKILKRNHLASTADNSNSAPTSPTTVNKDKVDAHDTSNRAHHEDTAASAPSTHKYTAAAMFASASSSAAAKVPCEHTTIFPDPAVDYKAEARKLTNAMLHDTRLTKDEVAMLVRQFYEFLAWPKTHEKAAYLHKKLSDLADDFALVMVAAVNQKVRRDLLHSLCMNARGMFNFFEMASAPIENKQADLQTLCPCNALGHACRISACSYEHFCAAIGLDAKARVEHGLTTGSSEMPAPTICPGNCRLPHSLRRADLVCRLYLDDPASHERLFGHGDEGYGRCALGHGQPARRWAILEAHRRLCEAVAPGQGETEGEEEKETEEEREGEETDEDLEPTASSGRRNPVGRLIEDAGMAANPELAESSKAGESRGAVGAGDAVATPTKKKSRWNLRGLRK